MNGLNSNIASSSSNLNTNNPAQPTALFSNSNGTALPLLQPQPGSNPTLVQQLLQAGQSPLLSALPQQNGNAAWPSQTPQQPSPLNNLQAALNQMAQFAMPFISPQLIQEAYALSSPVEASDEPLLIKHLLSYRKKKESYKDALNALHGRNGHSASLWKDYYLDHKDRLDASISSALEKDKEKAKSKESNRTFVAIADAHNSMLDNPHQKLIPTVKKPSPASFKNNYPLRQSATRKQSKQSQKKTRSASSTPALETAIPGKKIGRSTFNSLTGPAPVYDSRLPPPNAEVKAPEPPSRSPTPPTQVISHQGRGNRYTQEDRDYFIKFIGWRLKQDPTMNRNDLCQALAEKAPHHSAQSWASHWSNNHDLPDKILAAARGEDLADESDSSDNEVIPVKRRPLYKDPSTTEESEESGEDSDSDSDDDSEDEESDQDSDTSLKIYSESEMGKKNGAFTDADAYICAKYIASIPGWSTMRSRDRWAPFGEKFPQRSSKSWAEYMRRNEKHIMRLVDKIHQENQRPSILTQTARPSHKLPLPSAKRKLELGLDIDSLPPGKRRHIDSEESDDS